MGGEEFPDPKSVTDYLSVAVTLTTLPAVVVGDSVANLMAGRRRRPMVDTFLDSVMGHCYRQSTLRQLRILTPVHPLEDELHSILYTVTMANSHLPNFNTPLSGQGFKARWITEIPDRTPADPVILYLHGGGYSLKTCQPQISYICSLAKILIPHRVSIVALDYGIAPFYRYPTQRNEGLACLKKLKETCDKPILLGDSCGGNLALTLLLEEDMFPPVSVFGVCLISPWTDPAAKGGSMNSKSDILSKKRLQEMCDNFIDKANLDDPKVALIKVPGETWKRLLPENTCVVWGESECLADQVAEFVKVTGVKDFLIEKNGTHDCILRGMSPAPCEFVTQKLLDWVTGPDNDQKNMSRYRSSFLKRSVTLVSKLGSHKNHSTSSLNTSPTKHHHHSRAHDHSNMATESDGTTYSVSSRGSRASKASKSSTSSKASKGSKSSKSSSKCSSGKYHRTSRSTESIPCTKSDSELCTDSDVKHSVKSMAAQVAKIDISDVKEAKDNENTEQSGVNNSSKDAIPTEDVKKADDARNTKLDVVTPESSKSSPAVSIPADVSSSATSPLDSVSSDKFLDTRESLEPVDKTLESV